MATYRAKCTLNDLHLGIIPGGSRVPPGYSRLEEAIKRGWVEEDLTPEGKPIPEPDPIPSFDPESSKDDPDILAETSSQLPPASNEGQSIEDLNFLFASDVQNLLEAGISFVKDLSTWSVDGLTAIPGIGKVKAQKLMDEYSDME